MIETYLLDWANLLLRWAHVITAIAWVGSSFYFVFLDSSLVPPEDEKLRADGATGELWAVHGGGFYHPVKYAVRPPVLPPHLHWFFWESYSTWLTGFGLFTVLYLWNAGTFLVDRTLFDWPPAVAGAVAVASLYVFWTVYNQACKAFGERSNGDEPTTTEAEKASSLGLRLVGPLDDRAGRGVEHGILRQDRALELLQLPAGIEPELDPQKAAALRVGL